VLRVLLLLLLLVLLLLWLILVVVVLLSVLRSCCAMTDETHPRHQLEVIPYEMNSSTYKDNTAQDKSNHSNKTRGATNREYIYLCHAHLASGTRLHKNTLTPQDQDQGQASISLNSPVLPILSCPTPPVLLLGRRALVSRI
jgi:hypothetical protein